MTLAPQRHEADAPGAPEPIPVVLVLTVPSREKDQEAEREEELRSLCDTAGCRVKAVARQHVDKPLQSTYIGKGKIQEIWDLVEEHAASQVVFDVSLSPSQERNLEKMIEMTVVDYTALILHIFARNARTRQAMLAVELAQLEYNRSRLKRMWTHLDRIKAGTNMRGPGEKQLETDRRLVDLRIQHLKEQLNDIERRKERTIASRQDCIKVALVGYTNAGKSTLMNALTEAGVLAQDRLFATLDTRTARLDLDRSHAVVISDTVGFIRNLPHTLIASFHATLAEVVEADLLLHVVDASLPTMQHQIDAVEEVLGHIGAHQMPTIMVFNKADRAHSTILVHAIRRRYERAVSVSAATGEGLDSLREELLDFVKAQATRYEVALAVADGATAAFLHRRATVLDTRYEGEYQILTVEADPRLIGELESNPACHLRQVTVEPPPPAFEDIFVHSPGRNGHDHERNGP